MSGLALTYGLASAVLTAGLIVLAKMGFQGKADPLIATLVRVVLMAPILLLTAAALGRFRKFSFGMLSEAGWLYIVFAALLGAFSWLTYFLATATTTANISTALNYLSLPLIVVASHFLLNDYLTVRSVVGSALMILGAVLIAYK
jgi:bacterial/archaeal transporter family protein